MWCVSTWLRYVSIDDIVVVNQSNVHRIFDGLIDVDAFRRFSFAKQSDVVSAAWLSEFGGCFLDVDTVMVNNRALFFLDVSEEGDSFVYFGDSNRGGVHIGALSGSRGSSIASAWLSGALERLTRWEDDRSWAYLGNAVLEPLIRAQEYAGLSRCVDVRTNLATPELLLENYYSGMDRRQLYELFWFSDMASVAAPVSWADCGGIISLHNSWTPESFARLEGHDLENVDNRLGAILREHGDRSALSKLEAKFYYGS
ncbi:hypothetical protein BANT918_01011 [Brevibacterium antiquum CNRZ 918]|uniref:Glycosyltransferase sugar-binding region containing DXD motif-containing protein n=1 Tax=Brevibacterium antiquum CNRZ 918 TaxID=1255637 RepID=A0A2H1IHP3_9MICO|nr:hypothetical protein BANT918_01011 [Brevibacterium antiquum CNRZ 918]